MMENAPASENALATLLPTRRMIIAMIAGTIIIVRTNTDNTILVDGIEEEDGKSYLNVKTGGWLDVTEEFKYPAMCVTVPNYRSLESSFLNVRAK